MKEILIVEDEVKLRNELKSFLEANGFKVFTLDNFDNAINDIANISYDLMLLDINLPNINGEFICKEIRKNNNIPIIIVTSRNNEMDELISINYGADDFITKPYNSQILLARINRILNRNMKEDNISYKGFTLNISKSLLETDKETIDLTKNELRIMVYLLNNIGKIVSRDDLMNYLWDNYDYVDDNTLTVNINRLRAKLTDLGYNDLIITKRGQGYIIL